MLPALHGAPRGWLPRRRRPRRVCLLWVSCCM